MPLLYDMNGKSCGYTDDEVAPEGYWLRPNYSSNRMSPLEFLDKIGPQRFGAIWAAAIQNPQVAFSMMRGFAAQNIEIEESFPALRQMEQLGLLPRGTAIEVWQ